MKPSLPSSHPAFGKFKFKIKRLLIAYQMKVKKSEQGSRPLDNALLSKQAGLTLIELMVVIVILGILAALIVPNLLGNTEKANTQKAVTDITALENALDMYKLDNQRYPTTEQGIDALVNKPTTEPLPKQYREDGYIRRLPEDPWGNPYLIRQPGDHGKIDIYSFGPDGEPETEDDIGNWNLTDIQ